MPKVGTVTKLHLYILLSSNNESYLSRALADTHTHTQNVISCSLSEVSFFFFKSLQKKLFLPSKRLTAHFLGIPFQVLAVVQNAFFLPRIWKVTKEGFYQ